MYGNHLIRTLSIFLCVSIAFDNNNKPEVLTPELCFVLKIFHIFIFLQSIAFFQYVQNELSSVNHCRKSQYNVATNACCIHMTAFY